MEKIDRRKGYLNEKDKSLLSRNDPFKFISVPKKRKETQQKLLSDNKKNNRKVVKKPKLNKKRRNNYSR